VAEPRGAGVEDECDSSDPSSDGGTGLVGPLVAVGVGRGEIRSTVKMRVASSKVNEGKDKSKEAVLLSCMVRFGFQLFSTSRSDQSRAWETITMTMCC